MHSVLLCLSLDGECRSVMASREEVLKEVKNYTMQITTRRPSVLALCNVASQNYLHVKNIILRSSTCVTR